MKTSLLFTKTPKNPTPRRQDAKKPLFLTTQPPKKRIFITTLLFFLAAGNLLADVDPDVQRIFDDLKFMSYQLSLDTKAQEPVQSQASLSSSNPRPRKKATETPVLAPVVPNPITRQFTASTVWGDLSVKVLDYGTRMSLQVKSSAPAQGWMLQQGSSSNILFKGNVENNAVNFQIEIPRQYSPDLGLTVIVNSADGQNPAYIALK
jgi:hypothetical protein